MSQFHKVYILTSIGIGIGNIFCKVYWLNEILLGSWCRDVCLLTVDAACQSDKYDSWRAEFRRPLNHHSAGVHKWTAADLHWVLWGLVGVGTSAFCRKVATSHVSPSARRCWTFSSADAAAWLHLRTAWFVYWCLEMFAGIVTFVVPLHIKLYIAISALIVLVWWLEGHQSCKNVFKTLNVSGWCIIRSTLWATPTCIHQKVTFLNSMDGLFESYCLLLCFKQL